MSKDGRAKLIDPRKAIEANFEPVTMPPTEWTAPVPEPSALAKRVEAVRSEEQGRPGKAHRPREGHRGQLRAGDDAAHGMDRARAGALRARQAGRGRPIGGAGTAGQSSSPPGRPSRPTSSR